MALPGETLQTTFSAYPDPPYNKISYGLPFTDLTVHHIRNTFAAKRAYLVASTSLSGQTAHVKSLEHALGPLHAGTHIGIQPHTPFPDLIPIINVMRACSADILITLGGGSLTDGAKLIVYALANNIQTSEALERLVESKRMEAKARLKPLQNLPNFTDPSDFPGPDITIPIICIPTTLSAGEYTRFGGGTSPTTHLKTVMTHPKMFPALVILDPTLTLTTPEWVWLSTGVRSIDHAVEALCHPACPDVAAQECSRCLAGLIPNLLKTKANPDDLQARLQCQLASSAVLGILRYMPALMLAGASHGIGHQLGPFDVGHGQTSCVLLPAVLRYNASVNAERQKRVCDVIWGSGEEVKKMLKEAGLKEGVSDASEVLDVVLRRLGMPRSLKEVGVEGEEKLSVIARNSLTDACTKSNPRELDEGGVMRILEMCKG